MRDIEKKIDNTSPSSTGRLPAAEFNSFMVELERAVSTAGITLDDDVDTDQEMLAQAMARYASGGTYGRDLGAANAYVVTNPLLYVGPKAYFEGMRVRFWAKASNTGASTLNAFGLGAKKILDQDGAALASGAIKAGRMVEVDYDPTLDTGAGAFKLIPGSNNLIVAGGGTGTPTDTGTGGAVLRPCLSGVTGDLTGITSCGEAIASSELDGSSVKANAFAAPGSVTPGYIGTDPGDKWSPIASTVPSAEWIGWDFGSGYYATIDKARFQQYHNQTNRTDIWTTVQLEASQDLVTWVPVALFSGCTAPGDNEAGPVEEITFTAYSARAFRLRPTAWQRFTSAAVLIQCAVIYDVQFIKT